MKLSLKGTTNAFEQFWGTFSVTGVDNMPTAVSKNVNLGLLSKKILLSRDMKCIDSYGHSLWVRIYFVALGFRYHGFQLYIMLDAISNRIKADLCSSHTPHRIRVVVQKTAHVAHWCTNFGLQCM